MKKLILITFIIFAFFCFASADKMAIGAGYYVGSGSYGGLSSLVGAYFQYDLAEWLSGRVGAGNISANHHIESEKTTTYQGYGGSFTETRTMDISTSALPYIHAQLLAYVTLGKGRFYFGPGYFMSTLTGDGTTTLKQVSEYGGYSWNFNYDQAIEIKKQVMNGISMTLGGQVDITDKFYVFGETMVMGSYQSDYEYTSENTTTGSDYSIPSISNDEETGKMNFGLGAAGVGIGMYL